MSTELEEHLDDFSVRLCLFIAFAGCTFGEPEVLSIKKYVVLYLQGSSGWRRDLTNILLE